MNYIITTTCARCGSTRTVSSTVRAEDYRRLCIECAQRRDRAEMVSDPTWLREMYSQHSIERIAKVAGCSKTTVRNWMRRHGIPPRSLVEAAEMRWSGIENSADLRAGSQRSANRQMVTGGVR